MKSFTITKWAGLAAIMGIALLPFVGFFLREMRTSDGRKALPPEAANVEEHLIHGIVGGDFTRLLKANLPEQRFPDYARSLGLTLRFDPSVHYRIESTLRMKMSEAPAWWNPPEVDPTAYFEHKEGDDYLRVLSYRDGSAYLLVRSW
jgi:hypothetical protein